MLTDTFNRFVKSEQFGGVLLLACTVVSLVLANSPFAAQYMAFWHVKAGPLSIEHWINDALMAVFFLLIGLELERELYVGELSRLRNALLPAFAAVGGMAAPALIHFASTPAPRRRRASAFRWPPTSPSRSRCSRARQRVPPALKVFVVAFAVIDDLGAIGR